MVRKNILLMVLGILKKSLIKFLFSMQKSKFKTQLAAIAHSLLKGDVLSIKNGFDYFGCTNIPREISRGIEKKFLVKITRQPTSFKSRYGKSGIYFKYFLADNLFNKDGIEVMKKYVKENSN